MPNYVIWTAVRNACMDLWSHIRTYSGKSFVLLWLRYLYYLLLENHRKFKQIQVILYTRITALVFVKTLARGIRQKKKILLEKSQRKSTVMEAERPERIVQVVVGPLAEFLVALTIAKGTVTFQFTLPFMGKVVKNSF